MPRMDRAFLAPVSEAGVLPAGLISSITFYVINSSQRTWLSLSTPVRVCPLAPRSLAVYRSSAHRIIGPAAVEAPGVRRALPRTMTCRANHTPGAVAMPPTLDISAPWHHAPLDPPRPPFCCDILRHARSWSGIAPTRLPLAGAPPSPHPPFGHVPAAFRGMVAARLAHTWGILWRAWAAAIAPPRAFMSFVRTRPFMAGIALECMWHTVACLGDCSICHTPRQCRGVRVHARWAGGRGPPSSCGITREEREQSA